MSLFHLKIATPDGALFDGEAQQLLLRGTEGDLAILAGHTPFVTGVQPGRCKITLEDDSERFGSVSGGLLTVSDQAVILLSSSFRWEEP